MKVIGPLIRPHKQGAQHVRIEYHKGGGSRCQNLNNGKEASEVTEGKCSRMRWGR